jgi:hypothetical protein
MDLDIVGNKRYVYPGFSCFPFLGSNGEHGALHISGGAPDGNYLVLVAADQTDISVLIEITPGDTAGGPIDDSQATNIAPDDSGGGAFLTRVREEARGASLTSSSTFDGPEIALQRTATLSVVHPVPGPNLQVSDFSGAGFAVEEHETVLLRDGIRTESAGVGFPGHFVHGITTGPFQLDVRLAQTASALGDPFKLTAATIPVDLAARGFIVEG